LKNPTLSILVVFYNMSREAERTLYSLSTDYQEDVSTDEYEVVAIDNCSMKPLDAQRVKAFGPNFDYHFFDSGSKSPAKAVNFGAGRTHGEFLAVIVDGARMVSPGLIRESLRALKTLSNPFVCALSWHLGPDVQNTTILEGYDQVQEDILLDSVDWRNSGYRLFEISTLAQSSSVGFLGGMPSECSWFAMSSAEFIDLGGFDERFESPGGGLVNHDFLARVLSQHAISPIVILGEGLFHQIHGGVATNVPMNKHPFELFKAEYQSIHGRPFQGAKTSSPYYMGTLPSFAMKFINPIDRNFTNRKRKKTPALHQ